MMEVNSVILREHFGFHLCWMDDNWIVLQRTHDAYNLLVKKQPDENYWQIRDGRPAANITYYEGTVTGVAAFIHVWTQAVIEQQRSFYEITVSDVVRSGAVIVTNSL